MTQTNKGKGSSQPNAGAIENDDVLIRREGRAGRMTLNRPQALNALTGPMVNKIWQAMQDWKGDDAVELIIIDGAGERAFCAGGDVRMIHDSRKAGEGITPGAKFWREEYHLNALIARYPKPYVAIMSGIVMGGGVGLSAHGSHRIVSESSMLAMPETGIGLIPDVGGTWLLSHAQGELGTYLGLTGARMSGSDAIQAGFADSFVPEARMEQLIAALCERGAADLDDLIENAEQTVPDSPLAAVRRQLDDWFAFDRVEDILSRLNTTTDDLAQSTRRTLLEKSPLSVKLTLAAIRKARHFTALEQSLNMEFRLVNHLLEGEEFLEGVRAALVDKDRDPKWPSGSLDRVSDDMIAAHFAPLSQIDELGLVPPEI